MLYLLYKYAQNFLIDKGIDPVFSVLDQIQFRALAAAALAFVLVILLGRRTIGWLTRKKIGDAGMTDAQALRTVSQSKANTPTMGGVLIVGAIVASTLLLADLSNYYIALGLLVCLWLAVLGGFDDWLKLTAATAAGRSRQGLFAWEKLVFQIGLGLLVGVFAYGHGDNPEVARDIAHAVTLPLQKTYLPGEGWAANPTLWYLPRWAFIAWTILMIAGLSNAVNITDGMDGLAAGLSAAVALGLLVLTLIAGTQAYAQYLLVPYVINSDELSVMAGATLGACLGFLWWNCSPAQVFMGDTGSLALGGIIAYLALVIRQEIIVLAMCGVFLVEIASVVLQVGYFKMTKGRPGGGRRLFRCAPYHHHLHLGGWSEQKIVARFWIVSIVLVVAALASLKVR